MSNNEIVSQNDFKKVIQIIENAKENVLININKELINLYWSIGKFISEEISNHKWGDSYVNELAKFIESKSPGLKGFNRRGLYRMRQFYELYKDDEIVSPLVTQISWSNHLEIISGTKTREEREFYIKLCIKERYSKRELIRQIESAYYERYMLSKEKLSPVKIDNNIKNAFLDNYVLEFLNLPDKFSEYDLQKSIIRNLKNFILEIGSDFTYIGEEYKVQVGNSDYYIDLLFYHRGLSCMVAFELKIDKFKPEYIGKMNFYLEALDREYKRPNENPSVGVILCATKDDEVVEYALARSLSPTLIADYKLKLIDKKLLVQKLHEFSELIDLNEEEK